MFTGQWVQNIVIIVPGGTTPNGCKCKKENKMKSTCTILMVLLGAMCPGSERKYTAAEVISYARALNIATVDPLLSPQRLDDWLRVGAPQVDHVDWVVSPNCDEKAGGDKPSTHLPLCVKVFFQRGDASGYCMIKIGTISQGPIGPAHLEYILVEPMRSQHPTEPSEISFSGMSSKLSDLPGLLDEALFSRGKENVITYAKALDVSTLDSGLSSRHLDEWLRHGPARATMIAWAVTQECGLNSKTSERQSETRLCVRFFFGRGNVRGWGVVAVGTVADGPKGPPHIEFIVVEPRYTSDKAARKVVRRLSDLPELLDSVSTEADRRERRNEA